MSSLSSFLLFSAPEPYFHHLALSLLVVDVVRLKKHLNITNLLNNISLSARYKTSTFTHATRLTKIYWSFIGSQIPKFAQCVNLRWFTVLSIYIARITFNCLQTTVVHCLKTYCLESGLSLRISNVGNNTGAAHKSASCHHTIDIAYVEKYDTRYQRQNTTVIFPF
jgi:hypothetical protein